MTAKIICVTNQKGGVGKTTTTMQLAAALALDKKKTRVCVIDADRQGSATRWAASCSENKLFPADVIGLSAAGGKVHQEIRKFIDKYDWIIIDCPPAIDSTVPQSALMVADLALVPIVPSPPDLWAGIGIRELIKNVSAMNENLKACLVPNMCQSNTTLAREALEILNEFQIPLSNARLSLRQAYRQAAAFGGSVFDLGPQAKLAIQEVKALALEVKRLTKSN
jgi:chromosome partitioning protein